MRLISKGNNLSGLLVRLIGKHEHIAFASAWASSGTKVIEAIYTHRAKISHGVIGTHFYQTHPDVLDMFIGYNKVRFILQPSGVFHPKVYYFWTKSTWDLIIGSANMTNGGFGANQELSLHISSNYTNETSEAKLFSEETKRIIRDMWSQGSTMNKQKAEVYRRAHEIQKPRIEKLSGVYGAAGKKIKQPKSPLESDIMTMTWNDYFTRVNATKEHSVDGSCALLEYANKEFKKYPFASMDITLRRAIAGLNNNFEGYDWRWFGSMLGAGTFQNRINDNNIHLSNALDIINIDGAVTKQDYLEYIEEFIQAFPEGRGGVALASRLLAFKRPDYFLCLNKKNRKGLCEEFGIRNIGSSEYERYWTDLIDRIMDSVWWHSPQQKAGLEGRVWRSRVAMLDTIFYEWDA